MLQRAVVVGVSQVKRWSPQDTVAQVMAKLGENTGNMMFTESLGQVLNNPTTTSFAIPDAALEGRDCIVLASANWVNEFEDFSWLADRLEKTNLPVFLVGIGAQAGLDHAIPKVPEGTIRLLKLVSERSTAIAARGDFTAEVLESYGIKNVVSAGCPSMLLLGQSGPKYTHKASAENVVLHGTRHGFGRANAFQNWIYRQAMLNDWDLLLQSEKADVYFALGKLSNPKILEMATPIVTETFGAESIDEVSSYLRRRGLFFTSFHPWIEAMKTRSFCVGTRIHGTVAALLAGTPAVLIAHDSRTLELAQKMAIPHILSSELSPEEPFPIERVLAVHENSKSSEGYASYYSSYLEFFKRNGLTTRPETSAP